MSINFSIKGRLGNAIFRYMACSVLCIISNKKYECSNVNKDKPLKRINDQEFFLMATKLLNNEKIIMEDINYILTEYYQHDNIYKLFKDQIIEFVNNNRDHIIITDGINAGDGRYQIYKMYDIVNTNKKNTNGYTPLECRVGPDDALIAGFKEGLRLLDIGDKAIMYLPYYLAYGETGRGSTIPPKSNLIFEVEIIELK